MHPIEAQTVHTAHARKSCNSLLGSVPASGRREPPFHAATITFVPAPTTTFSETLQPHPAQADALAMGIQVQGHWRSNQALLLRFTAQLADLTCIQVPQPVPPAPADGLWQHTCFELFIAGTAGDAYLEYNLSPSGQWARYAFSAERVRNTQAEQMHPGLPLAISCERLTDRLVVQTELSLAELPHSPSGWRVGLSAVIEDADGSLSYWALHHPRPQPDFHHPAGRVLRLTPPNLS
jgi:hypothetical protein